MSFGGYLSLHFQWNYSPLPRGVFFLNAGRSSVQIIIKALQPQRVYLPYYICDVVVDVLRKENVDLVFYAIDKSFQIIDLPELTENDMLIYVNYFGLQQNYCDTLSNRYQERLIIDASQALSQTPSGGSWSFTSTRKFIGTPDGSYLYAPMRYFDEIRIIYNRLDRNRHLILKHLILRAIGFVSSGYKFFHKNEFKLHCNFSKMSTISRFLIPFFDTHKNSEDRRKKFAVYDLQLSSFNLIKMELKDQAPFGYPLLADKEINFNDFWRLGIYIPVLWKECLDRSAAGYEFEKKLAGNLLLLPLDERMNSEDCKKVAEIVNSVLNSQ